MTADDPTTPELGATEGAQAASSIGGADGERQGRPGERATGDALKNASQGRRQRPTSVLELVEYAYAESARTMALSRKDMQSIRTSPGADNAEMDALRNGAREDKVLAAPVRLLLALAEYGAKPEVRTRILELVLAALASHSIFAGRLATLTDPDSQAADLSATVVRENARRYAQDSDLNDSPRERLESNAVVAFGLYRVLRTGWSLDTLVAQLDGALWHTEARDGQGREAKAAALAAVRDTEPLGVLSGLYKRKLKTAQDDLRKANLATSHIRSQVATLEAERARLQVALASAEQRAIDMETQVTELSKSLVDERASRVVDKSHLTDDYEVLRTQVIRRLSTQTDLLNDGMHALRNGSTGVAEEFVDRALTAIQAEVGRLRGLAGGAQ